MESTLLDRIRKDLDGMSKMPDLTTAEILALPKTLKVFLRWVLLNRAVTCEEIAGFLDEVEKDVLSLVSELDELGLIERLPICGMPRYWVCLNPRRLRPPPELLDMTEE